MHQTCYFLSSWTKSHLKVYLEIFVEVPGGHEDEVLLGEAQAGEDVRDLGAEVALVAGRAHVAGASTWQHDLAILGSGGNRGQQF